MFVPWRSVHNKADRIIPTDENNDSHERVPSGLYKYVGENEGYAVSFGFETDTWVGTHYPSGKFLTAALESRRDHVVVQTWALSAR